MMKMWLIILLSWMASFTLIPCWAQETRGAEVGEIPDFKRCFDILAKNRALYNKYNDSIFIIKEHDKWVNFFRRRALKNHQIYVTNKEALSTITNYFKQKSRKIRHAAYDDLYNAFAKYLNSGYSDPFINVHIGDLLLHHYQTPQCPDLPWREGQVNLWMGANYLYIANLGNDKSYKRRAYECFKHIVETEGRNDTPNQRKIRAYGLWNLSKTQFLLDKIEPIEEFWKYHGQLRKVLYAEGYADSEEDIYGDSAVVKLLKKEGYYRPMNESVLRADEYLVRNVYMVDSTIMEKQKADSLMRISLRKLQEFKEVTPATALRIDLMRMKLGDVSPEEVLDEAIARYKRVKKEMKGMMGKKLKPNELSQFVKPFSTFFYINDIANVSKAKKRRIVRTMCNDIVEAYQSREDDQKSTSYIRDLNVLTTYERITKYLKPRERVHFLYELNVATQVTTYAHSVHVGLIARELMNGVLKYQPELLVGTHGYRQITDILRHRQKYLDFCYYAGIFHDLGKNSIISVVNNDYRPLFDDEFAIIKRHPELGLKFLDLDPKLAKYHDTTLGHHKWYNGKGGYPENFDNTQSPDRILIDMLTIADCMQAATERVGRNYKGDKTFDVVMEEFRRDAGVKYNPDLVALIDAHPDLAKRLAFLINDGWVEIYYDIYSKFIR